MRATARRELALMPLVMKIGLAVFTLGTALDVFFHTAPHTLVARLAPVLGATGSVPHLVTFVGMALITIGVLTSRRPQPRAAVRGKRPAMGHTA